jgi:hypothetical protein
MTSEKSMSVRAEVFWLRNKRKATSPMGYLREELHLDKAKISVRKLAKSAGSVFTSYDLEEIEESLFSQGLIATEEAATLVRSILLEEGYRGMVQ